MKGILIDFGYKTKSGMHEHLELAHDRKIVFPSYTISSIFLLKIINKLGWNSFFLSDWKKNIQKYDFVVVVASNFTIKIVEWLNKFHPKIKVFVYYFNIIEKDISLKYFENLNCTIATFDENDALKYGLFHTTNVTCKENYKNIISNEYTEDIIFIGTDKGRLPEILDLKNELKKQNINLYEYIVGSSSNSSSYYEYKPKITYKKNIEMTQASKIILDLYQKNQYGITLRPIDAGFMKKKLITNSKNIKKEIFYSKKNIFILNEDYNLYDFILGDYVDEFDYEYFDIENWLKRFGNYLKGEI